MTVPPSGYSQDTALPDVVGPDHVPDDAIAMAVASPSELIKNPALELFPVEVFRVQVEEQVGFDPADIESVRFVAGMSANGEPQFGGVFTHQGEVNVDLLASTLGSNGEESEQGALRLRSIEGPPGTVLCNVSPTMIYIGMRDYLAPMLAAKNGKGPLPLLASTIPARPGLNAAIAMESIRPMVSGAAMGQAHLMAPSLQPLAEIPRLTDAIKIYANLDGASGTLELTFLGTDVDAAVRIESILNESLVAARELAIAEVGRSLTTSGESDAMRDAIDSYAARVTKTVIETLAPHRDGVQVTLRIDSPVGIGSAGMIAGLLMPAIQSARVTAGRMSTANNFKRVGLALHNYHSAYRELPRSAIADEDGKPLLSWRVAILPFIEEQELYQKFHLDEPWDSEHNLPLSKKLPAAFETPGTQLRAGETVIQAVVGKDIGMRPIESTKFRDFLDGLSNSILCVEVRPEAAVPWSKPADAEFDLEDPLANLKGTPDDGFHVLIGDGAVSFLNDKIEPGLFKALLTRAGKEIIQEVLP
ncbi:DUF1559 family PulG-like putative transporter [Rubripirellula tenax]|nr:DUF1559 domain-containing protein [Rubripirellula tenax]